MITGMMMGYGPGMQWFGGGGGFLALAPFFSVLVLWSLVWKGLALWHSAQHKQHWWFVILLVVNTAGILEIIYLFAVLKLKFGDLFKKETGASATSPDVHQNQAPN